MPSGQSYAAFVTENIFKPLGMADSGYDNHKTVLARRASGYSPSPAGVVNADYLDMTVPQGAGGLYSTTHDLLKWQTGLFGGKVLKPESFSAFTTPYKNNYALGIVIAKADGKTSIEHSGGIDGFNTWVGYDPDAKLAVIVLANLNGGEASKLGKSMMTLGRGGAVTLASERKAITVPPAKLQEYVGTYELTPAFGFVVRYEGGKLTAQATKQDALEIFAERPDFFFFRATDAQITFTRDGAGKVTGAVLYQGGRDMPVKKK
ncbi:MAG: serine hydrolase [Sphingomonadales bacterium]|nr:MAG: serine hydrolase [Sphingomonadales bacterium]